MSNKTITKKKVTHQIKVTLHNLGKIYESKGKTVEEAITNLNPPIAKGHGVLVLEKGDKRKERILNARIINGVFGVASPIIKSIHIKNIVNLFNDFDK